jgi:hypothetical protein
MYPDARRRALEGMGTKGGAFAMAGTILGDSDASPYFLPCFYLPLTLRRPLVWIK